MGLPMFLEPACWADRLISWPCWRMILDSTFPRHIKEHLNSTRMGFIDLGLVTFWTVTPKSVVVTSHYEDLQNHGLHGLHVLMPTCAYANQAPKPKVSSDTSMAPRPQSWASSDRPRVGTCSRSPAASWKELLGKTGVAFKETLLGVVFKTPQPNCNPNQNPDSK